MSFGFTAAGIAEASLAIAAVGAGVGAYGAVQQASAARQADEYQAQVAANNQTIANENASMATQQGQQQNAAKEEQTAQQIGDERAVTAASGIDPNTGSAVRIQGGTAALGALDSATILNNAKTAAWGYQTQGMDYAANASLLQEEGSNASAAGALGAFSSIVGGASSVSNKWATYTSQGVF
jgi:hypothetical protein